MKQEYICHQCGTKFVKNSCSIRPNQKRVFCSHACHSANNFKHGLNKSGYRMVSVHGKQVYEHRLVMSEHLGRPLLKNEHVHHINGVKHDNRLENLELVNESEHHREHVKPSFDIDKAKTLYDSGVGYRKLEIIFGTARQNIRACFVNRGWHVEGRTRTTLKKEFGV